MSSSGFDEIEPAPDQRYVPAHSVHFDAYLGKIDGHRAEMLLERREARTYALLIPAEIGELRMEAPQEFERMIGDVHG